VNDAFTFQRSEPLLYVPVFCGGVDEGCLTSRSSSDAIVSRIIIVEKLISPMPSSKSASEKLAVIGNRFSMVSVSKLVSGVYAILALAASSLTRRMNRVFSDSDSLSNAALCSGPTLILDASVM
jgi:hypothetical protein